MTGGVASVFPGSKMETGIIDYCPGCKQRVELHSNGICEKCNEEKAWEDSDPRKKLPPRVDPALYLKNPSKRDQPISHVEEEVSSEKQIYLDTIKGAAQELIDEIVKDIYEKRILHYDFNQIIQNERWFSLMDLRRMALKVNPNFEKSSELLRQEDFEESYVEKPKRKSKRRAKK